MSPSDRDNILRHRAEAFILHPRPLWITPRGTRCCGIALRFFSIGPTVVPLTWQRYHQLAEEGSRVLAAQPGRMAPAALLRALWILSPHWSASRIAWRMFRLRHTFTALRHRARLQSDLRAFVADAFLESSAASKSAATAPEFPPAHLLGTVIAAYGQQYGWHWRDTLTMPVALSYQLQNATAGRGNPAEQEPAFNAVADRAAGDRLRAKRAALRAKRAATTTPSTAKS